MAERRGIITDYNPTNRQGKIRPEDNGPEALFYITNVSNPEPAPKPKDVVLFDAPEPRKNKNGKVVQDKATSVTIEERAPEPTPEQLKALEDKRRREERRRKGRGADPRPGNRRGRDGKGKGRGRERDRDSSSRRGRGRREQVKEGGDQKPHAERKKRDDKGKKKRSSIQSKIRYPAAQDIPRSVLHMDQSNPSLVFEKFIQWPSPLDATQAAEWKLTGKHRQFFLSRTLAPLYRNYERRTLPWAAVRSRRETMLRSLEQSGYTVASEIIKGPWRFALARGVPGILDDAHFSLQRIFGYPYIPADRLHSVLKRYVDQAGEAFAQQPEEVRLAVQQFLQTESSEKEPPSLLIFDAVPTHKIVQFTIERSFCCRLEWQPDGGMKDPELLHGRKVQALCAGDDAGFSVSIAAREADGQRTISQTLIALLAKLLNESNKTILAPGNKQEKKLPRGLLL